jgi:predicted O-methyltransferase YrrM
MGATAVFKTLARDRRHTDARSRSADDPPAASLDYYNGVVLGASALGERALSREVYGRALEILDRLDPDDYVDYVRAFVARGYELGGDRWRYADITTVLCAAAEAIRPDSYLEIGVRRGRSMAIVGSVAPGCSMVGVDMWLAEYAGMENPGPAHVRDELRRVGHDGPVELLSGNSHQVLPKLFRDRQELTFDLITVDGDHSPRGARRDIRDVLPRLRIGGVIVFDDVRHPYHPKLGSVWRRAIGRDPRYATWEFDDVGYGVALAVRRW